jgi:hypothetical protein
MAGRDVAYGQEPAAAAAVGGGGRLGNSAILDLASFLLQAADIVGEIKYISTMTARYDQMLNGCPVSTLH